MSAEILPLGDPAMHFWLTRSVARVMGVSLSRAMADNDLSAVDYAGMIARCRTCPNVTTCQAWLGQMRDGPAAAPAHCMNADRLARLADRELV